MHELGIAQGILDLVGEHVPPRDGARVGIVRVRVGALSGVSPDALAFGFEALALESPFPRARLSIERVAAACACLDCGHCHETERPSFACPSCGGTRLRLQDGADLQVVDIELCDPVEELPA